ncbi:MAG: InlB B-repeat-containing protein [Eubacteriales bacterium]
MSVALRAGSVKTETLPVYENGAYGPLPVPENHDFIFEGWYTKPVGGHKIEENSAIYKNAPHTLYAHWEAYGEKTSSLPAEKEPYDEESEYTVSFECDNTDDSFDDMTFENGVYGKLPTPSPREDFIFTGWFTKENGGVMAKEGEPLCEYDDHTLYAHFAPVSDGAPLSYTVTLDPDGGREWLIQSTSFSPVGTYVGLDVAPENIHIMHKSEWRVSGEEDNTDEEGGESR